MFYPGHKITCSLPLTKAMTLALVVAAGILQPSSCLADSSSVKLPGKMLAGQSTLPDQQELVSRLIIKPQPQADGKLTAELLSRDSSRLSKLSSVPLSVLRPMSNGAYVVELNQPVPLPDAKVISAQLMRDPGIELAEPDRIMRASALIPNDPLYNEQWDLMAPGLENPGGANLPEAWGSTRGAAQITVAVLDTGYRQHADLGKVLPGYDFISDTQIANDGDGRDADAQDPGDWTVANECETNWPAQPSDWHGTHVTGTIAATLNNNLGIAGIAPDIHILPVRVLGKCGGYTSDIVDAMRWAAGLPVSSVPDNPYPAQVLNLSLGASGKCSATFQSAINDVLKANRTIVIAAGNDGYAKVSEPANCNGVIAVTAHAADGDNSDYANVGPEITISAPGGGCGTTASVNKTCPRQQVPGIYSLLNTGTKEPANDSYGAYQGTSMATPHVTGVAALMLSLDPTLSPAQIKSYLQSAARSFPQNTYCDRHNGLCGAGLLDASRSLNAVTAPPPVVSLGDIPTVVASGDTVSLAGSAQPGNGRSIVSYAWTQQTGPFKLNLISADSPDASFVAPLNGTYSVLLSATDNGGHSGSAMAIIRVNSPPVIQHIADQTVVSGQNLHFSVKATDIDGDTLIFHAVSLPEGATLSASGEFTWLNAAPAGNYLLTYYASDDYADSLQETVSITVLEGPVTNSSSGGRGNIDHVTLLALSLLAVAAFLRRARTGGS